ncbi:MAG: TauD/TfdA family dioxygenase [Alphaproteobacteria bacterium]|nr:TauD/TfdA family dioxygenase [Alphaproteobacteria bacterium]
MALSVKPLHPLLAAEVSGVDLNRPVDSATFREVIAAMDRYGVCVYRGQKLADEPHIAFSRLFGTLELRPTVRKAAKHLRFNHPELFDAGNIDIDGNILPEDDLQRAYSRGNKLWHTDSSHRQTRAAYSLLNAHIVPPEGADTEFADMRVAYDRLPDMMKARIDKLVCVHDVWYSRMLGGYPEPTAEERKVRPPCYHRLVQYHHGSGRKTLYLASHASHIQGMPVEEGRALLKQLIQMATPPDAVYRHKWQSGDLVVWDNTCTMHRATDFPDFTYKRDLRRTTVEEAPDAARLAIAS